jgi:hypothetical protein
LACDDVPLGSEQRSETIERLLRFKPDAVLSTMRRVFPLDGSLFEDLRKAGYSGS